MALIPLLSAVIESADPPSGPHQPATKEAHFAILSVGLASGSTCERMDIRLRGLGCDQDTEYYLNGLKEKSQDLSISSIHFKGLPLLFHSQPAPETTFLATS